MFMEALQRTVGVDDLRTLRECNRWLGELPAGQMGKYDEIVRKVNHAEAWLALRAITYVALLTPAIYRLFAR